MGANAYDTPNPRFDRGPCSYNVPHQLLLSYNWRIPSIKVWGFFGSQVIGGWETNGILNLRRGLPFTVRPGIDNSLSAINADRADMVGDPGLSGDRSKAQKLQQPMVEALLSRLRHYCHTVHIKGPSLREMWVRNTIMDDGRSQEEYIRQVRRHIVKRRARWGPSGVRTECWLRSSINAACRRG